MNTEHDNTLLSILGKNHRQSVALSAVSAQLSANHYDRSGNDSTLLYHAQSTPL